MQFANAALSNCFTRTLISAFQVLPWIIYAVGIGYGYSGDEYWPTLEEQTPGWNVRGDRYWIRDCYRMFKTKYGGAQPSGAWAEQFSIISWPITHAILPRDLQRQLARILYELRHSFSAELFESPPKLGEFIAARSWNGTSRFQNFAQETHLLGQIAAALLLQGQLGTGSLIHPPALQRIGEDLDRERRGREWLRGARRFAQERAKIRGLALGRGAASAPVRHLDEARAEVAALGIEPRLVLRPKPSDASYWELSLESRICHTCYLGSRTVATSSQGHFAWLQVHRVDRSRVVVVCMALSGSPCSAGPARAPPRCKMPLRAPQPRRTVPLPAYSAVSALV